MTLTLLLDLDDTLLVNDIDQFLPAYLQALSSELAHLAEPQKLISTLLSATAKMVGNTRPDCTLKEVFDYEFYPALGLEMIQMQAVIDRFYAEVFPRLQGLTASRPEAVALVEEALERGYRVVIATNPLFPRPAIIHRLAWAGLPVDKYPFDLITSYETFHFAKPFTSFFAEILARLGWPEGPVVMVGDDLVRDIAPARQLGIPAFWITKEGTPPPEGPEAPTASGGLADLLPWLDGQPPESLQPDYTSPPAMLAILRATPATLYSLTEDLPAEAWQKRPESGEWALVEILAHLRDVEAEVNLPRLKKVLEEANPFLSGKDTDPWAEERGYIRQNGPQALHRFTAARLEMLATLERLQQQDWERMARHAIFGPTPLTELININAGHDRLHICQVHHVLQAIAGE